MTEPTQRPAPFSMRLTLEERARLERDRGTLSVAAYVKWRLFDRDSPPPRHRGSTPVKDHQALSAVLAKLGASRIANNLNQLAKAAHSDSLILTPDVEADLREAVADIAAMRKMIVASLGLSGDGS